MAVFGRNIVKNKGPYIRFCQVDLPFEQPWPDVEMLRGSIFIELSEDLLSAYCGITQSYSPFDPHAFIQLVNPTEIYDFSSKLLMWEWQLARTPLNYFSKELEYFCDPSDMYFKTNLYNAEQLKSDMIETLHFMIGEMHKLAACGKCLIIEGI
ncbi:MAG: hypothetical protein V4629_00270 [Pseudomonadota bacterium]